ncbi:MAG: hypothetical protein ABIQ32_00850 [Sphingomicrobium sp.]
MMNFVAPVRAAAAARLCGSGLTYEACHGPLTSAPPAERIDVSRRSYATQWACNAAAYRSQGVYDRLATELALTTGARVLDLGCGLGDGMAAMARRGASVLGIDENTDCLRLAAARLGLPMPAERISHRWRHDGTFEASIAGEPAEPFLPMSLAHSDLLRDDVELWRAVSKRGSLDAVTIWFTGTHKVREFDALVQAYGLTSDDRYAVGMELTAFRIASRHLKSDGVLQIVGRAAHPDHNVIESAYRAKMLDMAQGSPFRLVDIQVFGYSEPPFGDGMPVGPTAQTRPARKAVVSCVLTRT